jgi:hypothetical protein
MGWLYFQNVVFSINLRQWTMPTETCFLPPDLWEWKPILLRDHTAVATSDTDRLTSHTKERSNAALTATRDKAPLFHIPWVTHYTTLLGGGNLD